MMLPVRSFRALSQMMSLILVSSCGLITGGDCLTQGIPSLEFQVRDQATGDAITSRLTLVTRAHGRVVDFVTKEAPSNGTIDSGRIGAGTGYESSIAADGYVTEVFRSIEVQGDRCGGYTNVRVIRMQRTTSSAAVDGKS